MKKLTFFKLLALVACLSSALSASAYDFSATYNGVTLYYNITSSTNKTVEVTFNVSASSYVGNLVIPSSVSYNGTTYTVTAIGTEAFISNVSLTSITLPNTITRIGYRAFFNCKLLATVTIPNSVTTIGANAFHNCESLTNFTIGTGVTSIGENAFKGCTSLTSIYSRRTTPPTIQSTTFDTNHYSTATLYVHGPYAKSLYQAASYWSNFFYTYTEQYYDFLTGGIYYNITSNSTVKVTNKWGGYAALTYESDYSYSGNVTIPETAYDSYTEKTYNVTAIGEYAFFETRSMNLNSPSEAPSLRAQGDLKSVTVGNNVTTIKEYAFWGCTGLTSVTLGTGVTSIGYNVFSYCSSLISVYSNRTTPPTIQSTTFDTNHYSTTKVIVPTLAAVNNYKAANYWKNFYMILPNDGTELDYALNVEGGNIHFTTSSNPWSVFGNDSRIYAQASVATTPYDSSVLTAEVTVTQESIVSFDYRTRTIYGGSLDPCTFAIDGMVKLSTFAIEMNDWSNFTADLPAGTHTLTWTYVPTNPTIGYTNWFAVDNVSITAKPSQTGDLNGDGQVTIADVTELIDSLLSGLEVPTHVADVNGDGSVNIADVTALTDRLLSGN